MNIFRKLSFVLMACVGLSIAAADTNPDAVSALLDRIGGQGTADRFVTVVDPSLAQNGAERFVITSQQGKPCIKGSTLSAVTTGINWYLNHYAHTNLTWNRPTTTLGTLPVPQGEEWHTCKADYRYYLNYCTFSYSMSTWTWERWQQEIDWMALHGINIPLQIVGLDVVWRNMLVKDYGYTKDEANAFVAGPCFQAWFGMNNLEGWGGPNPDWWYDRQEKLAKQINDRMRELGIDPVLPGYAGMVPSNFTAKTGISAINQGKWCQFTRPYILNPNTADFAAVAANYYKRLEEVMGTSPYYSIDPFHEGANTSGIDTGAAYAKIYEAMNAAAPGSKWVIQQWQWSSAQYGVLDRVPQGKLIVLDLFSDGNPKLGSYKGHDAVYCALPNFGGRTGLMGRFNGMINGYFNAIASQTNIKGIGATPEAIEQVPVLYDVLFELPWHTVKPDPEGWMADYASTRYDGADSPAAREAWELLRNSALNCTTGLQGPHEAVMCARPAWQVNAVSSWGGTTIFYDPADVVRAAYLLLDANLDGENYSFDLADVTRQTLSDYSYALLRGINDARTTDAAAFAARKQAFLDLILDTDRLLGTNANYRLGRWTQMARDIADEVNAGTEANRQWLELNNARTLITTWGERVNSESAGLRDYSYRQWNGMLRDFYYPRWVKFFNGQSVDWYDNDHAWAMNSSLNYSTAPEGDTRAVASELLGKYMLLLDGHLCYRSLATDLTEAQPIVLLRGAKAALPVQGADLSGYTLAIELNGSTLSGPATSLQIPANAPFGIAYATLTDGNGTKVTFRVNLRDDLEQAFTCGGWRLKYEYVGTGGIIVTEAKSMYGAGRPLNLTFAKTELPITAISPDALRGNTDISELVIPSTVKTLDGFLDISVIGAAENSRQLTPWRVIPSGTSFSIAMDVTNDGTTFNQWGSGLLATGSNALGNNYSANIQFYLKAAQTLTVVSGAGTKDLTKAVGSHFTVNMSYNAPAKTVSVLLTTESGQTETYTISNYTFADITVLSTSIPAGVNLESLLISDPTLSSRPFDGCDNLGMFEVEGGNENFSTNGNGYLLSADGSTLLAMPMGQLYSLPFRMTSNNKLAFHSDVRDFTSPIPSSDNNMILSEESAEEHPFESLYILRRTDSGVAMEHLNSGLWMTNTRKLVQQPVDLNWTWKADGSNCRLQVGTTLFSVQGNPTVTFESGMHAVLLPVAAEMIACLAYEVFDVSDMVRAMETMQIIPYKPYIIKGPASLSFMPTFIPISEAPDERVHLGGYHSMPAGSFYTLCGEAFCSDGGTTLTPNTYHIPASVFTSPAPASVPVNLQYTSISEIEQSPEGDVILYDLAGRRVSDTPRTGLYITSKGTKYRVK